MADQGINFVYGDVDKYSFAKSYNFLDRATGKFSGYSGSFKVSRHGVRNLFWRWDKKLKKGYYVILNYPKDESTGDIVGNFNDPYNVFYTDDLARRPEILQLEKTGFGSPVIVPVKIIEKIWRKRSTKYTWMNREYLLADVEETPPIKTNIGKVTTVKVKRKKGVLLDVFDSVANISNFEILSAKIQNSTSIWGYLATRPIPGNWFDFISSIRFEYTIMVEGYTQNEFGNPVRIRMKPDYFFIHKVNVFEDDFKSAREVWESFLKQAISPAIRDIYENLAQLKGDSDDFREMRRNIAEQRKKGKTRAPSPLLIKAKEADPDFEAEETKIMMYLSACRIRITYRKGALELL